MARKRSHVCFVHADSFNMKKNNKLNPIPGFILMFALLFKAGFIWYNAYLKTICKKSSKYSFLNSICGSLLSNDEITSVNKSGTVWRWSRDPDFEFYLKDINSHYSMCEFPVVDVNNISDYSNSFDQPLLLHGFTTKWPAMKYWGKSRLKEKYGKRYSFVYYVNSSIKDIICNHNTVFLKLKLLLCFITWLGSTPALSTLTSRNSGVDLCTEEALSFI